MTARVIVYHSGYGCDTGCCGHAVQLGEGPDDVFEFEHPEPGQDPVDFARDLITRTVGAEHVADLDWEHCEIVEDHS
jgi:hypothetical protein